MITSKTPVESSHAKPSWDASLNWQTWTFGFLAPHLLISLSGNFGSWVATLLAFAGVASVTALQIWFAQRFVLPRTRSQRTMWLAVLGSLIITSFSAALVAFWAVVVVEPATNANFVQVINGTVFYSWFSLLIATYLADRKTFVANMNRLRAVRAQLEAANNWKGTVLNPTRETMLQKIAQQVEHLKDHLNELVAVSKGLPSMIEKSIRPLLLEIDALKIGQLGESKIENTLRPIRRPLKHVLAVAAAPNSSVNLAVALFTMTTWIATGASMGNVLVATVGAATSGVVEFLGLSAISRLPVNWKQIKLHLRVLLLLALNVMASALASYLPISLSGVERFVLIPIAIQTALVIGVISVSLAYREVGTQIGLQAEESNTAMARQLVENSSQLRLLREKLRHLVHGDLQTSLLALERKALSKDAGRSDQTNELLEEVGKLMDSISSRLEAEQPVSFDSTIRELQTIWEGELSIDVSISTEAMNALTGSKITSTILSEVLIEVITNAAKHDKSTNTQVWLDLDSNEVFSLMALSNFAAVSDTEEIPRDSAGDLKFGHGTALFNEVCMEWKLDKHKNETKFKALIPLVADTEANYK